MFIRTTNNIITDIQGNIKIRKAVYQSSENYGIFLTSPVGNIELGIYEDLESAENVITSICIAIEDQKPLFVMPSSSRFTKEDMIRRNRH